MIIPALLSAVHVLALGIGLSAVVVRGQALAGRLDDAGWRRVLAADSAWGVAALLWIASGLARVFLGGKSPDFYWYNVLFWVKLTLFAAVVAMEVPLAMAFMKVRVARSRGTALPAVPVERFQRVNKIEMHTVVAIVFVAAFMARGVWLF
jgi:putative membrane protein